MCYVCIYIVKWKIVTCGYNATVMLDAYWLLSDILLERLLYLLSINK